MCGHFFPVTTHRHVSSVGAYDVAWATSLFFVSTVLARHTEHKERGLAWSLPACLSLPPRPQWSCCWGVLQYWVKYYVPSGAERDYVEISSEFPGFQWKPLDEGSCTAAVVYVSTLGLWSAAHLCKYTPAGVGV